jgi:hypothetical protein
METGSEKSHPTGRPQTEVKHPAEWQADLNPHHMAGQNIGERAGEREQGLPTAFDVKEAHRALRRDFADDELRQIPILTEGQRLEQGATYLDIRDPGRREFTALGGMQAEPDGWYVPKDAVPYSIWNRLTGVRNPDRIPDRRPENLGG